jgi:protein-disulfide isomerase
MKVSREMGLNVTTVVLTLAALGVVGVRFEQHRTSAELAELIARNRLPPPVAVADWMSYAHSDERIGPATAAVTITEFGDFQCPFCLEVAGELAAIRARHPSDVNLLFRNYPLEIHRYGFGAARAAVCAARQGQFAAYHDQLFSHRDSLGRIPWSRFAQAAGVPRMDTFDACVRDTLQFPEIDRDTAAGNRLGVIATPTLLINGLKVVGDPGQDSLEHYVDAALRQHQQ